MIPFWKKTGKDGKKKPQKPAVPRTAQQSIPMQRMFEDGTCRVKPNYYTRTIQYQDINYHCRALRAACRSGQGPAHQQRQCSGHSGRILPPGNTAAMDSSAGQRTGRTAGHPLRST